MLLSVVLILVAFKLSIVHNTGLSRHATNHGGVTASGLSSVGLLLIDLGMDHSMLESLCVRINSVLSTCVDLVYRPGLVVVTQLFFTDLSDILKRLVTVDVLLATSIFVWIPS